ncbi:type II secretion system protein [Candidatus Woesebacteria bacterium]|nr:type II secretion system protein [Candidatus Woesebacteria bacterium]
MVNRLRKKNFGFTLIELLIVMAVLGVLATVALVIINPTERQAEARDTGRISSVVQIGRAISAYYTSKGEYPAEGTWAIDLVDGNELSTFPAGIEYSGSITPCVTFPQPADPNTFCYEEDQLSGNGAIVFSKAESLRYRNKCTAPEEAYFVFSTADARGGTICSSGDPSAWASGTMSYVD